MLVSTLNVPTLRALAFAQATAPATLVALKVSADDVEDPLPADVGAARRARSRSW